MLAAGDEVVHLPTCIVCAVVEVSASGGQVKITVDRELGGQRKPDADGRRWFRASLFERYDDAMAAIREDVVES